MIHGTESGARSVRRYEHGYNGFQGVDSPAEAGHQGKYYLAHTQLLSSGSSGTKSAKQDGSEDEVDKKSPAPLPKTNMIHGTESGARSVRRYEHGYNGFQGVDSPAEAGHQGKNYLAHTQLLSSGSSGTKSAKQDGSEDEAEKSPAPLPRANMIHGTDSAARSVRRYEDKYDA